MALWVSESFVLASLVTVKHMAMSKWLGLLIIPALLVSCSIGVEFSNEPHSQTKFLGESCILSCEYNNIYKSATWTKINKTENNMTRTKVTDNAQCNQTASSEANNCTLKFSSVTFNDTGLYFCSVDDDDSFGTYLRVISLPSKRILNLNEDAKNKIITIQGVILFLCVIIPGLIMLINARRNIKIFTKIKHKEEDDDNLYEGLNLDDMNSMYHDISHSKAHSPYQDVGRMHSSDSQLEKP
uniref:CD79a molecule, immunoglobulin-associated alpha n=1 Tax=Erpetoichthys calabaricus TaxID=27687 RepID=A0A8C4T9V7_ERPCA